MQVNAQKIKSLRTGKNWTQTHLAEACAVSLRTIQRVERYGVASNETLMGLASVLEVDHTTLVVKEDIKHVLLPKRRQFAVNLATYIALIIGIVLGALMTFVLR